MNNKLLWIALIVVTIIAIGAYSSPKVETGIGVATSDCSATTCLTGGLRITSGDFSVVSGAGATTTAQVGCVQTIATSSATTIKLSFNSTATTSAINSGTIQGVVLWQYGTCP